jgi:hypothetical protein
MSDSTRTPFSIRCEVLGELWTEFRDVEEFQKLFHYGDLAFPMAAASANGWATILPEGERFVDDVFEMLLEHYGIVDSNFESLDELLVVGQMMKE